MFLNTWNIWTQINNETEFLFSCLCDMAMEFKYIANKQLARDMGMSVHYRANFIMQNKPLMQEFMDQII